MATQPDLWPPYMTTALAALYFKTTGALRVVRGRATDARTGQQKDVWRVLTGSDKNEAYQWLQTELGRIRSGAVAAAPSKTPFATYAVSLLERKVNAGTSRARRALRSGRTR
jgi:hypothetical protein